MLTNPCGVWLGPPVHPPEQLWGLCYPLGTYSIPHLLPFWHHAPLPVQL